MPKPIEIKLCRGRGCCPVITISEDGAKISDDEGGEVTISKEQLAILRDELNCLDTI